MNNENSIKGIMTEAELFDEWIGKAKDKGISFGKYKAMRRKEITLIYKKICPDCGEEFETEAYQKIYCPKCASIRKLQANFRKKKKVIHKSLIDIMFELNEYNQNNEHAISYGEFVQMKGY